jgi:hypothetical protein
MVRVDGANVTALHLQPPYGRAAVQQAMSQDLAS